MNGEPFRLDGDVAVITGGAQGLGRAIAEVLAARGATVVVVDVLENPALQTAREIRDAGGVAEARTLDVTDEAAVETTFSGIVEAHGQVDVLVNNAGIARRMPATEMPREVWERVMGINATGVFLCARAAARRMIARKAGGRIVNIASIMGFSGGIYPNSSYNASKGAVVNLTRALAVEWAPHGIRVNGVAPTFVRTDLTTALFADARFREAIEWRTPMGREAEPADVAHAVLFLASRESGMITGHTLPVDGGFLAW